MDLLVLTSAADAGEILPSLPLLSHRVTCARPDLGAVVGLPAGVIVLVDATKDIVAGRTMCRMIAATDGGHAVAPVLTEGGLVAVGPDWGISEFLVTGVGPAELDARLRLLAAGSADEGERREGAAIVLGDLAIDEDTYTARLRGRPLDLTYKEFELLKFLAMHPGKVFTRAHLLQEVWGYDFFGGTRTVDVHVRRLRAKLGTEYEAMIGTVRNVGYKVVEPGAEDGTGA